MQDKSKKRQKRHLRVRRKIQGTPERPRLSIYRSLKNIYAQVIDDSKGNTLTAASSSEEAIKSAVKNTGNKDSAFRVGELIAERALAKGIEQVVFDRGGNIYTGRVRALAEGARKKGLKF